MSAKSSPPVAVGEILSGKYRVERVLGEGGMGVVVAATHLQLRERVALKFLLLEVSRGDEGAARFLREAQAAVKIKSEHVARVSDVGTLESGAPYLVMEYLDGHDLSTHLAVNGRLGVGEAVEYVLQACEALAEAHQVGIVHRDLKPANLFRVERADGTPCIKILDFGISKLAGSDPITKPSSVLGTPEYMSPEQLRSTRDVDHRSDVWSLGVILYELLADAHPFHAETVPDLCAAILKALPARLRDAVPSAPVELEAVIDKCLSKDAGARYASVAELARDLEPFASDRARASVERIVRTSRPGFRPALDARTLAADSKGARRRGSEAKAVETAPTEAAIEVVIPPPVPFRAIVASASIAFVIAIGLAFLLFRSTSVTPASGVETRAPLVDALPVLPTPPLPPSEIAAPSASTASAPVESGRARSRPRERRAAAPSATSLSAAPTKTDGDFGGRK